jgi:hypothetical protein
MVAVRADGRCEASGDRPAEEMSHRISRGRGGLWHPANLLHLSGYVHRLCHAYPARAYALGWFVETGVDPASRPVWLARPWAGWWQITDLGDGGQHVLVPLHEEDLARDFPEFFTNPGTGEITIPEPPRLPEFTPFGAQRKDKADHAHR